MENFLNTHVNYNSLNFLLLRVPMTFSNTCESLSITRSSKPQCRPREAPINPNVFLFQFCFYIWYRPVSHVARKILYVVVCSTVRSKLPPLRRQLYLIFFAITFNPFTNQAMCFFVIVKFKTKVVIEIYRLRSISVQLLFIFSTNLTTCFEDILTSSG